MTTANAKPIRKHPLGLMIVTCVISEFILTVYGSITNVALPQISKELHSGVDGLQWIVTIYILTFGSLLIFSGTLADRFGRKRILILGNALLMVGAIICGLAPSTWVLIAGRGIQGIGSSMMAPAGLSLLSVATPSVTKKAMAVMWWTATGAVTLSLGPILGGLVVHSLGWRWVFWAAIPLCLAAIVMSWLFLTESKAQTPRPFDIPGLLLSILVLAALAFCMSEGSALGWTNWMVLASVGIFVIALACLIPVELRQKYPVVPVRLFLNAPFTKAIVTATIGYVALAGLLYANTFYLQGMRGMDSMAAGLLTIPLALGATVTALLSGRLVAKGDSKLILRVSGILLAVGAVGLWATDRADLWWTLIPYALFGAGTGFITDPISVTALESLPVTESSLASSFISTAKEVGQMIGVGVVGVMLGSGASHGELFHRHGWMAWLLMALSGLVIVLLNFGKSVRNRTSAPQLP